MSDAAQIQVERLSNHFLARWIERLGKVPSLESINLMLRKGQVTKRGEDLYKSVNGRLYRYHTLTEVWNHPEGVLIWIDERRLTAVTVIVPENGNRKITGIERHPKVYHFQGRMWLAGQRR